MILYAIPISTYSAKVRIALEAKGLDYQTEPPPGGYSMPEYMQLVPLGTIPALVDGEFCCSESDVLIEYLDETYPEPALLYGSPAQRAQQRFMARYHDIWLEPHLRRTFAHVDPVTRNAAELNGHLDKFQDRIDKMESLIDPSPYLCGNKLSIADCAFPATFTLAELLLPVFGREPHFGPKVRAWVELIYRHPAVKIVTDESRAATLEWMNSGGG
ncbi:MAG: glutathione S-transferase [Gammaproteobacteria bacterium]|jgi:glutathione S-transferase